MGFKHDLLLSELRIMLAKEKEMLALYIGILEKLENPRLHERLRAIRDDERKHVGYVEILLSLFEEPPDRESFSGNAVSGNIKDTFR